MTGSGREEVNHGSTSLLLGLTKVAQPACALTSVSRHRTAMFGFGQAVSALPVRSPCGGSPNLACAASGRPSPGKGSTLRPRRASGGQPVEHAPWGCSNPCPGACRPSWARCTVPACRSPPFSGVWPRAPLHIGTADESRESSARAHLVLTALGGGWVGRACGMAQGDPGCNGVGWRRVYDPGGIWNGSRKEHGPGAIS